MMRKIYSVAILCFLSSYGFAQKITFNTIGFELKPEDRAKIERLASYEARIFNGLYDNLINDSLKITLNLYNKKRDFKSLLEERGMKGLTESGFYSPVTDQSYIYFEGIENLHTVLHEISHALLKNNSKYYPRWFTEGLAEFLETLQLKNFDVQIVAQFDRLERMKYQYQKEEPLNLLQFLNNRSGWQDKKKLDYLYTTSYAIIYFLNKTDRSLISKMAQMYKKGYPQEKIFSTLFGSVSNFEKGFNDYYR
ncbi:DUF1570 domain-containing protein [Pedobacter sp. SD-b]|uniref:DUF1570 domain-containing protein n=1 Tax=Pedobacter segetis TaxID=2793069 RepID=A0ABS1BI24_9SPHI|nr:DUF1570 domain-containing protein [Pedobacter segetis]MBK0382535.1 DUF1570 domain-containing protein [Pedobacter segetis]